MSPLTKAVLERDVLANKLARSMGKNAIIELNSLMHEANSTTRAFIVNATSDIELAISHELIVKALDDEDINVIHTAVAIIEKQQASVSTDLLKGLLEKLKTPDTKNRIILLLGQRLKLNETAALEKYCSVNQPQSVALHSMAALAKIGVEQRRKQFSAYLLSIKSNAIAFNEMVTFIEYINQSWLIPSLKSLLNNKEEIQFLSTKLLGYPSAIRVCDKAVRLIAILLQTEFSFKTHRHKNFTDEQLAEVNLIASNYQY
ncbi:MAG: hypothetical protein ACI92O_000401 [Colwellia sp.]